MKIVGIFLRYNMILECVITVWFIMLFLFAEMFNVRSGAIIYIMTFVLRYVGSCNLFFTRYRPTAVVSPSQSPIEFRNNAVQLILIRKFGSCKVTRIIVDDFE